MNKPLIILTGPTAVGKTALSISLAKAVNGEMISADSMQVYRHMDIGTAKITQEEMQGIPHYLIDVLNPQEPFDVVRFKQMAEDALAEIYAKGKLPIVVGGTGFYIQALLYDIQFSEEDGERKYRRELEALLKEKEPEYLHDMLRELDSVSAELIHANNTKRVIRAIEYYKENGEPISVHNERERSRVSPYRYVYFVLNDDRDKLYSRIDKRIDEMLSAGLVDEVKRLVDMGCTRDMTSMAGLGYKEILAYLEGETTFEEAVAILKRDTRHFAKRQITWFKREKDVIWLNRPDFRDDNEILYTMQKIIKERVLKDCET